IVLTGAVGVQAALRDSLRRHVVGPLLAAAAVGYLLALGDQGVTGSVYLFLFHHLPGFAVMREPQKAVALLALAYGYFFGVGSERFIQSARTQKGAAAMGVAMVVLPIAYNPSLFWGLHGRL